MTRAVGRRVVGAGRGGVCAAAGRRVVDGHGLRRRGGERDVEDGLTRARGRFGDACADNGDVGQGDGQHVDADRLRRDVSEERVGRREGHGEGLVVARREHRARRRRVDERSGHGRITGGV